MNSVGIFALTNDRAAFETGVTSYNLDLTKRLCEKYPKINFTIYLSPINSRRFDGVQYPNLIKIVLPTNRPERKSKALLISVLRHIVFETFKRKKYLRCYQIFLDKPVCDLYIYTVFGLHQEFPRFVKECLKRPCISTIHDIRFIRSDRKTLRKKILNIINKFKFRRIINNSARLLLPSQSSIDHVQNEFGCNNTWLSYSVPNLVSCPALPEIEKYALSVNSYFYFPATIVDTKNHLVLLEAFRLFSANNPGYRLVLSGSNYDSPLGMLIQEKIREFSLQEKVLHLGFISECEKQSIYASALAAVFPTKNESFNLGVWEAFFLGCPVITSNDFEMREQADNAAFMFDVDDHLSLFEAMQKIKSAQGLRDILVERGYNRYKSCESRALISGWLEEFISY